MAHDYQVLAACKMLHHGEWDNKYISEITGCTLAEVVQLHQTLKFEEAVLEIGMKIMDRLVNGGVVIPENGVPRYVLNILASGIVNQDK
ncbi:hypothetical protein P4H94_07395 [Paenibacillus macerans]|uniref:Uncharacterized protein n=1 Tax=Paenibacillus macerans TaxID=44252 RepID=A0A6N8ETR4_PAEMA|nr:hypothetical protein [Paenibacillus macerans]MEC0136709.1 hypothetical protein [Paenibacillus macerans]MED4955984.1 hypothetical protein [Paenibacillus macerans]MUG21801.1 hypothetical protein [Paenibacillus macerans]